MLQSIKLRYGPDYQEVTLPDELLLDNVGMQPVQAADDPDVVIEIAIDSPIGTQRLEDLVQDKKRVVILVDDLTRPTPVYKLLPPLTRRLARAGIPKEAITILVATGTHRPMTTEELRAKLGSETLSQYRVVNHDYRVAKDQVQLGTTPSGIPITVNRLVAESDFVIGVGNIVPHRYCGWAGGAKIIQPGVGGEATTAGTHLMITKDPEIRLGVVENRVRHEMEAVAERANLKFIVNTILDPQANIVDVVAGDFRFAFREGVRRALQVYRAPVRGLANIVIASAYPSDLNLWQAGKAFYSADLVVRDGGIIILVSPCFEGVGEHTDWIDLLEYDYDTINRMIENGQVADRISAAASLAVALILARARIWLVTSHISAQQADRMKARSFASAQDALDAALGEYGEGARVTILHQATEILPVFES